MTEPITREQIEAIQHRLDGRSRLKNEGFECAPSVSIWIDDLRKLCDAALRGLSQSPGQEPKSEGADDMRQRLKALIKDNDKKRGRPLTDHERLANLRAELAYQRGFEACREMAVEAAEAVSEKYVTAARKARDEEDYDLFEDLESKAVAVGLVIEAISALTPETESEPVADSGSRRADLNCEPSGPERQNGLKPQDNPQSTEPVGTGWYVDENGNWCIPTQPADPIADEGGADVAGLVEKAEALFEKCGCWPETTEDGVFALIQYRTFTAEKLLPALTKYIEQLKTQIEAEAEISWSYRAERDQLKASNDKLRAALEEIKKGSRNPNINNRSFRVSAGAQAIAALAEGGA